MKVLWIGTSRRKIGLHKIRLGIAERKWRVPSEVCEYFRKTRHGQMTNSPHSILYDLFNINIHRVLLLGNCNRLVNKVSGNRFAKS